MFFGDFVWSVYPFFLISPSVSQKKRGASKKEEGFVQYEIEVNVQWYICEGK